MAKGCACGDTRPAALALELGKSPYTEGSEGNASTRASSASSSRSDLSSNAETVAQPQKQKLVVTPAVKSADLAVRVAKAADVSAVLQLYNRDYVGAHQRMYAEAEELDASEDQWSEALGNVDFAEVLKGMKAGDEDVRLLVCVDRSKGSKVVGYALCELRSKGPKKKKQLYCELVNIVVAKSHHGCGAGRYLFEAFVEDAKQAAPGHAQDLRLFVAEKNQQPLSWYRRLGFRDSGWQVERVGGAEVRFLRMIRKEA